MTVIWDVVSAFDLRHGAAWVGGVRVPLSESYAMSGPGKIRSRGPWSHIVSKATDT